jgi:hypothetical protein
MKMSGTQVGPLRFVASPLCANTYGEHWTMMPSVVKVPTKKTPPSTADEWVQQNINKVQQHAGQWIAVTHKGIVATSGDFDDVFGKAREQGIANPMVFRVPSTTRPRKIVSVRSK